MDVIFDWNLGNMIYNGPITLRLCGFPFAEIGVVSDFVNLEIRRSDFSSSKVLIGVGCVCVRLLG